MKTKLAVFAAVAIAFLAVAVTGEQAYATHYPNGSLCYDCHAVSRSSILSGTRLIRRSPKTTELGWTTGSAPCLFCHESHAVSVAPGADMVPVDELYSDQTRSKHRVIKNGTTGGDADFDCTDCHNNAVSYVSPVGGNANVHGVDALTGDYTWQQSIDIDPDLPVVNPTDPYQTCANVSCHNPNGTTVTPVGTRFAPPSHNYTYMVTVNGGPAPDSCGDCHGTHGSPGAASILTLREDGTSSDSAANLSPYVTEANCGLCHNADDGGVASVYETKGHGGNAYAGTTGYTKTINLTCNSCHDPNTPHDFPNRLNMRFNMPLKTASTSALTGKNLQSVCTNCHQAHPNHQNATGCLDCHDPHGQNLGANIMMVREKLPFDANGDKYFTAADIGSTGNLVKDTMVYARSGSRDTGGTFNYWPNNALGYSGSSNGVCDNYDCHSNSASPPEKAVWPFSTWAPGHAGGVVGVTVGENCGSCHAHKATDGWVPGAAVCGSCHGYPPNGTDQLVDNPGAIGFHALHNTTLAYGCSSCHSGNIHNDPSKPGGAWTSNTGIPIPSAYVEVDFSTNFNPAAASYVSASKTCSGLVCHNPDDNSIYPPTGKTLRNATAVDKVPDWDAGVTIDTCQGCHADSAVGNSHRRHEAASPTGYGFSCRVCHSTLNASTNSYSGTHADGDMDHDVSLLVMNLDNAGANFTGLTGSAAYVPASKTCTNLYCHGVYTGNTPAVTPDWDAVTGGACGNCHSNTELSTGAHQVHTLDTTYNTNCKICHVSVTADGTTIADTTLHVNALADISFDTSDARMDVADTYSLGASSSLGAPYGTCTNLYCHGTYTGNTPVDTPDWATATTADCGDCHSNTTMASGSHTAHVDNATYNISCNLCHNTVTTDDGVTFNAASYGTRHVDGNVDVEFNTANPKIAATTAYSINNSIIDATYGTCANTYCHSTGAVASPWTNTSITWNTASTCASCHATTPATGSHTSHMTTTTSAGGACTDCHTAETDYVNHVNQTKTIKATLTFAANSCSTNACHNNGKNAAPRTAYTWGTAIG
ncbi:CxxxxCH/CxxCH domain-containing protein, partial [bacterium]